MTCLRPILFHIDASSHVILISTLCTLLARLPLVHPSLRGLCLVSLVVVVHVLVRVGQDAEFVRNMWVTVNLKGDLSGHFSWKHGHETAGGTKMLTQSSGYRDGCSFINTVNGGAALEQYLRGAPKETKVEAWEGRILTCSRPISWDVSVAEGCKVTVSAVYLPKKRPGPPAAGPLYRILFGWSRLLYTASSGIWIFRGALRGSQVLPALASCFDWVVRGTYRTAWAVQPCCRCSYSYGNGPAVGPQVSGNW